jgi:hypothetical protein
MGCDSIHSLLGALHILHLYEVDRALVLIISSITHSVHSMFRW